MVPQRPKYFSMLVFQCASMLSSWVWKIDGGHLARAKMTYRGSWPSRARLTGWRGQLAEVHRRASDGAALDAFEIDREEFLGRSSGRACFGTALGCGFEIPGHRFGQKRKKHRRSLPERRGWKNLF